MLPRYVHGDHTIFLVLFHVSIILRLWWVPVPVLCFTHTGVLVSALPAPFQALPFSTLCLAGKRYGSSL